MKKILLALLGVVSIIVLGSYFISSKMSQGEETSEHNTHTESSKPIDQSHRRYEMELVSKVDSVNINQPTTIVYKIKNDKGELLKNYQVVHEKNMHFIVVRKDLEQFQHLHPEFNQQTGEFTVPVNFTVDGPYRLFPDFTPGDDNPQKLAVTVYKDINVGNVSGFQPHALEPNTNNEVSIPVENGSTGYQITYSFPKELKAQQQIAYSLNVKQNGQEVNDLQQYLGAMGHGVILKKNTLDFIHTHAEEISGADHAMEGHELTIESTPKSSNKKSEIDFAVTFPESGTYKIFTQFQHKDKVLTTDYVVQVN
ncbi:MAG: hypothetical protein M3Q44_00110 [bacterium]|nr:hypothetical protein [bacterium]